jgi:hypothetical protein
MTAPIHLSDWASQPDVRIACDQYYGTPAYRQTIEPSTLPEGVYELDDGRLYTFDDELNGSVTCPACVAFAARWRDTKPENPIAAALASGDVDAAYAAAKKWAGS